MKLVVDTDVIAAALLGEPATGEEAADLLAGAWDLHAPSFWRAELTNVIWKAARRGGMAPDRAADLLLIADALPVRSVETADLWQGALARAILADHPAYDAFFVELAVRLNTRVASYDAKLRRAFPEHVALPSQVVRGG